VPDLTRPGEVTAMTAQHAQRQGVRAAANRSACRCRGCRQRRWLAYHLLSLPANRARTAVEWATQAALGRSTVNLGLVSAEDVPLSAGPPAG
jgi:NADH:ubiquinone reductase (H+-translocating)